jgi:hypothetical protein
MENRQGGHTTSAGTTGYDQFESWIRSENDPQQIARAAKVILSKLGEGGPIAASKDVLQRELRNDPTVAKGVDFLTRVVEPA